VTDAARFGVILKSEDTMKRKDDPVRERLSVERRKAETWLRVLCKGVAACLMEGNERYPEELDTVLDVGNNYLRAAIAEVKRAEEAYAPYWRWERMRYIAKPKAKKVKAA
jgi:hypothetical protein